MPHCSKCGTSISESAAICPNCGAAQSTGMPAGTIAPPVAQPGLSENAAGLLCYLVGWITGLIFLLVDKRPFVRFHAAQSLIAFGILNILSIIVSAGFIGSGFWGHGFSWSWSFAGPWFVVRGIINVLCLIVWIVGMIKAYQHERFRFPIVADLADQLIGSVPAR